jgi:hypothetical protein
MVYQHITPELITADNCHLMEQSATQSCPEAPSTSEGRVPHTWLRCHTRCHADTGHGAHILGLNKAILNVRESLYHPQCDRQAPATHVVGLSFKAPPQLHLNLGTNANKQPTHRKCRVPPPHAGCIQQPHLHRVQATCGLCGHIKATIANTSTGWNPKELGPVPRQCQGQVNRTRE